MQSTLVLAVLLAMFDQGVSVTLRNSTHVLQKKVSQVPTFESYYNSHTGRGVWKWTSALGAYQRHFMPLASRSTKLLEVGVQSGGSINMYRSVLPLAYYYGMDINRNCLGFADQQTTIYLGDQAQVPAWQHFFSAVTPNLDICIDDGGHQPHQMLATIQQVLPRMNQGGFYLTEDIHGINDDYLHKFLQPAAYTISGLTSFNGAQVQSVHLYPFILGVQMAPGAGQQVWVPPQATVTVRDFISLMAALPANPGGVVKLENPAWATLFGANALFNFFGTFNDLNGGVVKEVPEHCHSSDQSTNQCVMIATNTNVQNLVKAVHIYQKFALVEVNQAPPVISATRKGDVWIPYNGP